MQNILTIAFYVALIGVLVILALGLINLVRKDERQASRSNQLMRLRVLAQAIAVGLLVVLGFVSGAISLPF
ncbi:MAG: twin transmembrane helix small protein [Hyphomonadaceae bacterium]|nr:twin transmembrane helix small protein [Hyphomonadaceae bacterium]